MSDNFQSIVTILERNLVVAHDEIVKLRSKLANDLAPLQKYNIQITRQRNSLERSLHLAHEELRLKQLQILQLSTDLSKANNHIKSEHKRHKLQLKELHSKKDSK